MKHIVKMTAVAAAKGFDNLVCKVNLADLLSLRMSITS